MDFTFEELKDISVGVDMLFALSKKAIRNYDGPPDKEKIEKRNRMENLTKKVKTLMEQYH